MAAFQIETGSCNGRGFASADTNGLCAKFYTWITKTPAQGGPGWFIIDDQSTAGSDPYIVVSDVENPSVNDYNSGQSGGAPKFVKVGFADSSAGNIRIYSCMWWDVSTHTGYGYVSGHFINTLDAGDFVYSFRGGEEMLMIQSRIGSTWDYWLIDDWVGNTNFVEAPTVIGTLQSSVSSGSSVTLQLNAGEASLFTANKHYYIMDYDGHTWCDYVEVTAVDTGTDQITVDTIRYNFPSGAIIGAYPHRYYVLCNGSYGNLDPYPFSYKGENIPYASNSSAPRRNTGDPSGYSNKTAFEFYTASDLLGILDPDDIGNYAVTQPLIIEDYNFQNLRDYMNRAYGVAKNLYCVSVGSMAQMLDGYTIAGLNYIYFTGSSPAFLVLDTESES